MEDYSNLFVCLMGMGTVFFGLICLIGMTGLMSALGGGQDAPPVSPVSPAPRQAAPAVSAPAGDRPPLELLAAVSAALAEDLGTEPAGIRIISMKKV